MTIAFGVLLLGWPAISLTVLVLVFGAFALFDGALILIMGLAMPPGEPTRPLAILAGGVAATVGVLTVLWPGVTELVLLVLIALRALVVGVAEVITAVMIRRHVAGAWLLATIGIISIGFGTFLVVYPHTGVLAIVWVIGLYVVLVGFADMTRAGLMAMTRYA